MNFFLRLRKFFLPLILKKFNRMQILHETSLRGKEFRKISREKFQFFSNFRSKAKSLYIGTFTNLFPRTRVNSRGRGSREKIT